jgi:hypothetical protein
MIRSIQPINKILYIQIYSVIDVLNLCSIFIVYFIILYQNIHSVRKSNRNNKFKPINKYKNLPIND